MYEQWKEKNIKKGWNPVNGDALSGKTPVADGEPEAKKRGKEKVARKSSKVTATSAQKVPAKKKKAK